MAALDFPTSPTNGQVYGNFIWSTTKDAWQAKPLVSAKTVTSDVAPGTPQDGDQWFNTVDGTLYIYVVDVDGGQWVESQAPITANGYYSPNYIINGGFDIWQRGTSFTPATAITYTTDRFFTLRDGTGATVTTSQQTFTPGTAPVAEYEGRFFYRYAQTVAGTGGTYVNVLQQRIEDVRTLAGQNATVSFWAKADSARTMRATLGQHFGTGGSPSGANNVPVGDFSITTSWQRFSATIALTSISGKVIGTNNDSSLQVIIQSITPNVTQTFDIWGVQVEAGSIATAFRRNANSIQGELAACQRYYYRNTGSTNGARLLYGMQSQTTVADVIAVLPVELRISNPTIDYANVQWTDSVAFNAAISAIVLNNSGGSPKTVNLSITFAANGAVRYPGYISTNAIGGYFGLSAEL